MSANSTEISLSQDLPRLLRCSVGAVFIFGILVENLIIIVAILHSKKYLARQTRIFLLNVTIIDLLTGLLIVPPLILIETFNNAKIFTRYFYFYWIIIGGLLLNARVLALLLVGLDRYLAICQPIRYSNLLTFSRSRLSLVIIWCLALALIIPRLAVFSVEFVEHSGNATELTQQPVDWTYTTSKALRGLLVFMFFLRFAFPLSLILVLSVLAFRVAVTSSEGFRQGILKVREPEIQPSNEEKHRKDTNNTNRSRNLGPRKIALMRIHRGNYMNEGTKDLFAQLPKANRSLSRRTAVLPNINPARSHSRDTSSKSSQVITQNKNEQNHMTNQELEKEQSSSDGSTNGGHKGTTPENPLISEDDKPREYESSSLETRSQGRTVWWRLSRSSTVASRFKFPRKKLKDLGSMIPFIMLLTAFFIFSLPYQILQVLKALWIKLDHPHEVHAHLFWLACANALINPVILTFWSTACRAKVLHLISCGRFHQNQPAIKRLIIASFGTANLPYGRQVRPQTFS